MKPLNILLFILLLQPFSLLAQTHLISGRVIDIQENEPLVGAHILMESSWRVGVVSDANGMFQLIVPDSLYQMEENVIISFVSYKEKVLTLSQVLNDSIIGLEPLKSEMKTVTIRADRMAAEEFTVKKIERIEVYKNPSAKGDALLAVNSLPSSTTVDESANVSFRGAGPNQTGIFLNGVPIYDAVRFAQLNGIGTFSIFNTEIIKKINVFPGNPPLEYGNISSGLIALETNDYVPQKNITSVTASLASAGFLHSQKLTGNMGITAFSNHQRSEGLKGLNPEALKMINTFQSTDFGLNFILKGDNGKSLKVFNYSLVENYDVNFNSATYSGSFQQERVRNFSVINFLQPLHNGVLSVNSGYSISGSKFNFSISSYDIESQHIFSSVNYHKEKKRSGLKFGITYDGAITDFAGVVPEYEYALRPEDPHVSQSSKSSRHLIEPYLYKRYSPSKYISFGYAFRTNVPIKDIPWYLSFQSHISLNPKGPHSFILSRGRLHQVELTEEGSSNLIRSSQNSLDHKLTKKNFSLTNSIFYNINEVSDIKTRMIGVETAFQYNGWENIFLEISYTGLDVANKTGGSKTPGIFDISYFLRFAAEYELNQWTIGVRGLWRQGIHHYPVQQALFNENLNFYNPQFSNSPERLPDYSIIDLNISRLLPLSEKMMMVAFASVSNVLDRQNINTYSYNFDYSIRQPEVFSRRTFFIGCVLNFY